ncbi:MAG: hypothetical protein IPN68_09745 [Bacteroidetes bacterium]|nr:hypothetical protein [Bacteroidota bacterium]
MAIQDFYSVSLKWKAGSDDKTQEKALSYNLRVGTTSGGNQVFSSMTSTTDASIYSNPEWVMFIKIHPGS